MKSEPPQAVSDNVIAVMHVIAANRAELFDGGLTETTYVGVIGVL